MKNTLHLNSGDLAEQAGAMIASRALEATQALPTQAERFAVLTDAIGDLCDTPTHPRRAIGGFSVVLIGRLDHVIANNNPGEAAPC